MPYRKRTLEEKQAEFRERMTARKTKLEDLKQEAADEAVKSAVLGTEPEILPPPADLSPENVKTVGAKKNREKLGKRQFDDMVSEVLNEWDGKARARKMKRIINNLYKIATDHDPKKAEAAIKAATLLIDRGFGKAKPSQEEQDMGIKVVLVNPSMRPPVVVATPRVLVPSFINELPPAEDVTEPKNA